MGSTFSGRSFFNSAIDFCAYTDDIKFVGDIRMTKQIITTTNAPAAIGPYSQAVLTNGTLYASGQIGLIPSTGEFAGETTLDQATQVFKNIDGLLAAADMTRADIVKVSVYLADMADFAPVMSCTPTTLATSMHSQLVQQLLWQRCQRTPALKLK